MLPYQRVIDIARLAHARGVDVLRSIMAHLDCDREEAVRALSVSQAIDAEARKHATGPDADE